MKISLLNEAWVLAMKWAWNSIMFCSVHVCSLLSKVSVQLLCLDLTSTQMYWLDSIDLHKPHKTGSQSYSKYFMTWDSKMFLNSCKTSNLIFIAGLDNFKSHSKDIIAWTILKGWTIYKKMLEFMSNYWKEEHAKNIFLNDWIVF